MIVFGVVCRCCALLLACRCKSLLVVCFVLFDAFVGSASCFLIVVNVELCRFLAHCVFVVWVWLCVVDVCGSSFVACCCFVFVLGCCVLVVMCCRCVLFAIPF